MIDDDDLSPADKLKIIIDVHIECVGIDAEPKDTEEYIQLTITEMRKLLKEHMPDATLTDLDDLFDDAVALIMKDYAQPNSLARLARLGAEVFASQISPRCSRTAWKQLWALPEVGDSQ
jgi:hypothetical protein